MEIDTKQKVPMPKQISSFIFISIIVYLEKNYPELIIQSLVNEINQKIPYYVENLKTGGIELVSLKHLKDERYWFSYLFMNAFAAMVKKKVPEHNLFFNAGDSVYQTPNFLKTAVGMPFLGPQKMVLFLQRENDKYNRTKDIVLLKSEKGHSVFQAVFLEGIVPSPFGMEWGAGLLRSYIRLSGATNVEVSHKWIEKGPQKPGDKGRGVCEFNVTYKDPGIFKRFFHALIFHIPIVKKEINHTIKIQAEHKDQIINQDKIIAEKTNELKQVNEKLLELDKLKTEFYTNITHELRTPLTLIKSQMDAVQLGHFGLSIKNTSDIFESVNRNADLLTKLIDNLLDFSKIESGKMITSFKEVLLSDFLSHIYPNFESAVQYKNLTFEYIDKTQNLHALIDKDLFEKAIYNLLSNAIKFTPSGGHVILSLDVNKNEILISVKDTGIGIAKDNHEIIFDRFRQLESSSTRKYEGVGIGLSLTKKIINLHRGNIKVESEPGKGAIFTLILPKVEVGIDRIIINNKPFDEIKEKQKYIKKVESKSIGSESSSSANLFSVLIVEDNNDLRVFIQKLIISKYTVYMAKNGIEALSILDKNDIDLVITDIMMPEMDGIELLKKIRNDKSYSWLPVIMLTARVDFLMKMKGFSQGASDYIMKPFKPDELLARIKAQLFLSKLRREYQKAINNKNKKSLTDNTIIAIEKVQDFIRLNYQDDISRDSLSSIVEMSPDHLSRMFKKYVGMTIKDFVHELRIENAIGKLWDHERKIIDIAYEVGFDNISSFNRIFKKLKGLTPSDYRKKQFDPKPK